MGEFERKIRQTIFEHYTPLERARFEIEIFNRRWPYYCIVWTFQVPSDWTDSRKEQLAWVHMDIFHETIHPDFPKLRALFYENLVLIIFLHLLRMRLT